MAELGCIASIVGIAGVGIKLSKTLYQIGHTTTNAGHNINKIATNVTLFSSSLKHVGVVLQDQHSLHSPEAIETIEQIVRECESVFQEITKIVYSAKNKGKTLCEPVGANDRRRRLSVVARAKWYFEQPKVDYLLAQLEYLKTTLSVLMQTLNLAAITAQVKEAEIPEEHGIVEEVVRERLHVETLIVAQQLSVNILQESQDKYAEELESNPEASAANSEMALDQRYPKLLTQGSQTSLQLVRLGDGTLEFLDRRPSGPSEEGAPLEQTTSRSEAFIDELLHRWTVPPPRKIRSRGGRHARDAEYQEQGLVLEKRAQRPTLDQKVMDPPDSGAQTPELQLQLVESPEEQPDATGILPPTSSGSLDPKFGPPRSRKSSQSNDQLGHLAAPDQLAPPDTLVRTRSNPECDGMQDLEAFQDHHGLNQPEPRQHVNVPYFPPPPPMPQSFWSTPPPAPNHAYALTPYMPNTASKPTSRKDPNRYANYRAPQVQSDASSSLSSDSEYEKTQRAKGHSRRGSKDSKHSYKDSGIGEGLDIPWRIRIGKTKYFDFRDDKLVGPRTPYIPSESRAWIQSQENARTELRKSWVNEDAIIEKRYKYRDLREERDGAYAGADEDSWVILQPLKFYEVEALVARTVDYFRKRSTSSKNPPAASSRVPQPYSRVQPGPAPPRNVSVNNEALSHNYSPINVAPGIVQWPASPAQAAPFSPVHPLDPIGQPYSPRTSGPDWRQKAQERAHAYERDRSRERWLEERDHDRHSNRDRDRDRDRPARRKHKHREREVKEEKKVKGSSMAGTLAKIGGLAALLEGLDGAF